jgi:hypothetical protein
MIACQALFLRNFVFLINFLTRDPTLTAEDRCFPIGGELSVVDTAINIEHNFYLPLLCFIFLLTSDCIIADGLLFVKHYFQEKIHYFAQ